MLHAGRPGWVLELAKVGNDPHDVPSADYSVLANQGLGIIVRLNHGYGIVRDDPVAPLL